MVLISDLDLMMFEGGMDSVEVVNLGIKSASMMLPRWARVSPRDSRPLRWPNYGLKFFLQRI